MTNLLIRSGRIVRSIGLMTAGGLTAAGADRDRRRPGRRDDVPPQLIPLLRGQASFDGDPFPLREVLVLLLASTMVCLTIGVLLAITLGK